MSEIKNCIFKDTSPLNGRSYEQRDGELEIDVAMFLEKREIPDNALVISQNHIINGLMIRVAWCEDGSLIDTTNFDGMGYDITTKAEFCLRHTETKPPHP